MRSKKKSKRGARKCVIQPLVELHRCRNLPYSVAAFPPVRRPRHPPGCLGKSLVPQAEENERRRKLQFGGNRGAVVDCFNRQRLPLLVRI